MIMSLITKILVGIIGTGLSTYFINGVEYDGNLLTIIYVGAVLGLLLFFLKPLLKVITFPLRVITLNLFTIIIIMGLIWIVDIFFPTSQFEVVGLLPLFYYSLVVWVLEFITSLVKK
jgi:putative membrane protein